MIDCPSFVFFKSLYQLLLHLHGQHIHLVLFEVHSWTVMKPSRADRGLGLFMGPKEKLLFLAFTFTDPIFLVLADPFSLCFYIQRNRNTSLHRDAQE